MSSMCRVILWHIITVKLNLRHHCPLSKLKGQLPLALHIRLCRLHDSIQPSAPTPPHVLLPCLFVYLFTLVHWHHVSLALFVCFPLQIVSVINKQWADDKSNCTRLRSSLLLKFTPYTCHHITGCMQSWLISLREAQDILCYILIVVWGYKES